MYSYCCLFEIILHIALTRQQLDYLALPNLKVTANKDEERTKKVNFGGWSRVKCHTIKLHCSLVSYIWGYNQ